MGCGDRAASPLGGPLLPRSVEVQAENAQTYLVTLIAPALMDNALSDDFDGRLNSTGASIGVHADALWPVLPQRGCSAPGVTARDTRVRREPFGWSETCLTTHGVLAVRMMRVDDEDFYCENFVAGTIGEAERARADDVCRSMQISWHADKSPDRFRFPCAGWLVAGTNVLDEPALITRLECPPESREDYRQVQAQEMERRSAIAAAIRKARSQTRGSPEH
jgi:hypothetical protein